MDDILFEAPSGVHRRFRYMGEYNGRPYYAEELANVGGGGIGSTETLEGLTETSNASLSAIEASLAAIAGSASLVSKLASSAANTNQTNVKAGAGVIDAVKATNTTGATILVHLFDKATGPAVGVDAALDVLEIPAGAIGFYDFPAGLGCAAGIGYAITAANGDAVAAGAVTRFSLYYR